MTDYRPTNPGGSATGRPAGQGLTGSEDTRFRVGRGGGTYRYPTGKDSVNVFIEDEVKVRKALRIGTDSGYYDLYKSSNGIVGLYVTDSLRLSSYDLSEDQVVYVDYYVSNSTLFIKAYVNDEQVAEAEYSLPVGGGADYAYCWGRRDTKKSGQVSCIIKISVTGNDPEYVTASAFYQLGSEDNPVVVDVQVNTFPNTPSIDVIDVNNDGYFLAAPTSGYAGFFEYVDSQGTSVAIVSQITHGGVLIDQINTGTYDSSGYGNSTREYLGSYTYEPIGGLDPSDYVGVAHLYISSPNLPREVGFWQNVPTYSGGGSTSATASSMYPTRTVRFGVATNVSLPLYLDTSKSHSTAGSASATYTADVIYPQLNNTVVGKLYDVESSVTSTSSDSVSISVGPFTSVSTATSSGGISGTQYGVTDTFLMRYFSVSGNWVLAEGPYNSTVFTPEAPSTVPTHAKTFGYSETFAFPVLYQPDCDISVIMTYFGSGSKTGTAAWNESSSYSVTLNGTDLVSWVSDTASLQVASAKIFATTFSVASVTLMDSGATIKPDTHKLGAFKILYPVSEVGSLDALYYINDYPLNECTFIGLPEDVNPPTEIFDAQPVLVPYKRYNSETYSYY